MGLKNIGHDDFQISDYLYIKIDNQLIFGHQGANHKIATQSSHLICIFVILQKQIYILRRFRIKLYSQSLF